MWPDPKDIGLIVVAIIAGCFSCWTAFNSMDSSITAMRVKWLDSIKGVTAEYLASLNSWLMELSALHAVEKELERIGELKYLPSMEAEYQRLESKKFEIEQKVNKHLYDAKVSQNRIYLELDDSDSEFNKILALIDETKSFLNDLKSDRKIKENSGEVVGRINTLKCRSRKVYKKEWEAIRKGDRSLLRRKKACLIAVVVFVLLYILYVGGYIVFNDSSALLVHSQSTEHSVLFRLLISCKPH